MAETNKSREWWRGKSEAEIEEHYREAEESLYRPWGSQGDGRAPVTVADFTLTAAQDTLEEDGEAAEASRVKVAAFWTALAEWKRETGVKAKIEDTLDALAFVDRDDAGKVSWTHLGEVLGVAHQTARERFTTYAKYQEDVQRIARSVGLAPPAPSDR